MEEFWTKNGAVTKPLQKIKVIIIFEEYSDVITIKELAEMLQIKVYRAYQLVKEKRIKRLDIGKPYLIPKSEVIRFVKESVLE